MPGMTLRIFAVLLILYVSASNACSQSNERNNKVEKPTGIKGTMLIGPVCPGPQRIVPDPKCADRPYRGRLAVDSAPGEVEVATFTPSQRGEFSVAVPPGQYVIKWLDPPLDGRTFQSSVIHVTPNQMTSVRLRFDTRMR
jgi:hypothetical protein